MFPPFTHGMKMKWIVMDHFKSLSWTAAHRKGAWLLQWVAEDRSATESLVAGGNGCSIKLYVL